VGVHWTDEDPDCRHEGYARAVGAHGRLVTPDGGAAWWTAYTDDAEPADVAGLCAYCACGWIGEAVTPLVRDDAGRVLIDESEDAALIDHHRHVREVAGTARLRGMSDRVRSIVREVATTEELSALARLGLVALAQQTAAETTPSLVRQARAGGASWSQVGAALGITRQAAQQRYGAADVAEVTV
jgi:hypothetical protein